MTRAEHRCGYCEQGCIVLLFVTFVAGGDRVHCHTLYVAAGRHRAAPGRCRPLRSQGSGHQRPILALYWLATRPFGLSSAGFLDEQPLVLDGLHLHFHKVCASGCRTSAVCFPSTPSIATTGALPCLAAGATPEQAAAYMDVLEDYVDADSLRRLNGAEASDYQLQSLPPPRNDWILSTQELARMPGWAQHPDTLQRMLPWLGVHRDKALNPNTAPLPLLMAFVAARGA